MPILWGEIDRRGWFPRRSTHEDAYPYCSAVGSLFRWPHRASASPNRAISSERSSFGTRAARRCKRSCCAAWRCCIRSTIPRRRRPSRKWPPRTIPARSPPGATRSILMSNPLQGIGASPKSAELAQAAIDKGRKMGAKTQRERDYLEAVAAYYEDFANRPERARQLARAKAYEALAAKYPDDDEAQIFYALYLAGTQTASDQTYAAYLKAAGDPREAVREASRPSGRRALPDPQLRRAADRRRACPRRAATPRSRRTRRTRCTCPRTSSPASARGPTRRRPTAARPTPRKGATIPTTRCTRWTT